MFKNYRKNAVQAMRPYVMGEDMSEISVSAPDKGLSTLEGGMVAVSASNSDDKWYVAKKFFDENYALAEPSTAKERLVLEQSELRSKLDKLTAYFGSGHYGSLNAVAQELLTNQSDFMHEYLVILEHRLHVWED